MVTIFLKLKRWNVMIKSKKQKIIFNASDEVCTLCTDLRRNIKRKTNAKKRNKKNKKQARNDVKDNEKLETLRLPFGTPY